MLEGFIIFNLSGSVKNSSIPELVVGDNNSVKLKVKWLDHETIPNYKDLTDYVVEGVYTRPDGKVSPALTFSIDPEDNKSKYLVFGSWLTEIAGIAKLTVRFKQDDEIKATGQISLVIQDGSTPADVVITEPQHESLQEAIQAEENARKAAVEGLNERIKSLEEEGLDSSILEDIQNLQTDVNTLFGNLSTEESTRQSQYEEIQGKLSELEQAIEDIESQGFDPQVIANIQSEISTIKENLSREIANRQAAIVALQGQIANSATKVEVQNAQNTADTALGAAETANNTLPNKLDKVFSGLTKANAISESDYFVINSNNTAYKVTFSLIKELLGGNESATNNYLGDFDTLEDLQAAYATAIEGNYAYVKGTDGIYVMYLWIDGEGWTESGGGKYVLTATFDNFKVQLSDGSFAVKSAEGYNDNGTFKDFITLFANISNEIDKIKNGTTIVENSKSATGYYQTIGGATNFIDFNSKLNPMVDDIEDLKEADLYNNSTPTTQALGGIPKGTTFTEKPITEVLDMLLYPYVAFSTSISMSPKNGGVVRTQDNQTVTGCTVSITKGSASISSITVKYGNAVKATKTENIGTSNSFTFDSPITITSSSSVKNLTVTVTDSTGAIKSANSSSFTFVDPYYYGVTTKTADELTINDILNMTEDVKTRGNKSYTYTMSQQRAVIAYPASYGNLSSIKDANNFEVLDTFNKVTIENYGVNYYVYVLDGLNTATMKYTFSY